MSSPLEALLCASTMMMGEMIIVFAFMIFAFLFRLGISIELRR
jgi:hypothetical protein